MRRQRIVRPPSALAELKYWELARLAHRGVITWEQVRDLTAARVRDRNGGIDPYAHLGPLGEPAEGNR